MKIGTLFQECDTSPLAFYVVTVNYDSSLYLQRLIESLKAVPALKELIIVDHSPVHNTFEFSANFPITVVRHPNLGYGSGLNRGMRHISEEDSVVLLCNPDVEMMNAEKMGLVIKEFQENSEIAAIAPCILTATGERSYSCRRFFSLFDVIIARAPFFGNRPDIYRKQFLCMDKNWEEPFDVEWASGCGLFFRLRFFPYPLCFDERFFLYFEDVDLCAQIHRQGLTIKYLPDVVLRHDEQRASISSTRFRFVIVMSFLKFFIKYRGLPTRENLLPSATLQNDPGSSTR